MKFAIPARGVTLLTIWVVGSSVAVAQQFGSRIDELEHSAHLFDADPNMTTMRTSGDYRFKFVRDGIGREYFVHVPKKYHGQPLPMLVALHAEDAEGQFSDDQDLIRKSDTAGFILVAPNGYSLHPGLNSPNGGRSTWNAGRCCGEARNHDADDVGYIREVISRVGRQTNVDRQAVFAMGYSSGAMMAWRLACEAPEIRGIAAIAGTDNTSSCQPSHPVPVIQFHAMDDRSVPFDGGKGRRSISEIDFSSVPTSQAKWIAINHADPAATRTQTDRRGYCDLHKTQTEGAPVELCVSEKGGHWPALPTYKLMWDFFSSL